MFIINYLQFNRWLHDIKPHIVADSAFGSLELLKEINTWGGFATFASSINKQQSLWNTLAINTPANTWRAAINDCYIFSSHTIYDKNNKIIHQQVMTNGFTFQSSSINNSNNNIELIKLKV